MPDDSVAAGEKLNGLTRFKALISSVVSKLPGAGNYSIVVPLDRPRDGPSIGPELGQGNP
jgi:hypothetical protein